MGYMTRAAIRRGREKYAMTGLSVYLTPVGHSSVVTVRDIKFNTHLRMDATECRELAQALIAEAEAAEKANENNADKVDWQAEAEKWKKRSRLWENRFKNQRVNDQLRAMDTAEQFDGQACEQLEAEHTSDDHHTETKVIE